MTEVSMEQLEKWISMLNTALKPGISDASLRQIVALTAFGIWNVAYKIKHPEDPPVVYGARECTKSEELYIYIRKENVLAEIIGYYTEMLKKVSSDAEPKYEIAGYVVSIMPNKVLRLLSFTELDGWLIVSDE